MFLSAFLIPISGPNALISLPQQMHCSPQGLQVGRERPQVTLVGVTAALLTDPAFLRAQALLYLSEHLA